MNPPTGGLFFRRKIVSLIDDAELACVRRELAGNRSPNFFEIELTGEQIVIHEAEGAQDLCAKLGKFRPDLDHRAIARSFARFQPVLRFVLQDKAKRLFRPERYCFRGSVDDWIVIGEAAMIGPVAQKFIPHLGSESFFELHRF